MKSTRSIIIAGLALVITLMVFAYSRLNEQPSLSGLFSQARAWDASQIPRIQEPIGNPDATVLHVVVSLRQGAQDGQDVQRDPNREIGEQQHSTEESDSGIGDLTRDEGPHEEIEDDVKAIPVVYFFASTKLPRNHYQWSAIRASSFHNDRIVLLTNAKADVPEDLREKVKLVALKDLETPALDTFKSVYKGWGLKEPWEAFNFRRFFYLNEFMKSEVLEHVFFADSDVVVLRHIEQSLLPRHCDSLIDLRASNADLAWNTFGWSVWAGSGILSATVLTDWTTFVNKLYSSPSMVIDILQPKREKRPFVCDMTLWYLYAVAADPDLAERANATPQLHRLPATLRRSLCNALEHGFDHKLAFKKKGFSFDRDTVTASINGEPLSSIHYQGPAAKSALVKQFAYLAAAP